jgi:hypothetical protein
VSVSLGSVTDPVAGVGFDGAFCLPVRCFVRVLLGGGGGGGGGGGSESLASSSSLSDGSPFRRRFFFSSARVTLKSEPEEPESSTGETSLPRGAKAGTWTWDIRSRLAALGVFRVSGRTGGANKHSATRRTDMEQTYSKQSP